MSTQLSHVVFYGHIVAVFEHNGQPYVSMKQICEDLGLDWPSQIQRIKRRPVLSKRGALIALPTAGGVQKVFCLPLSLLNVWLIGIETSRVRPEVSARLIQYQEAFCASMCF